MFSGRPWKVQDVLVIVVVASSALFVLGGVSGWSGPVRDLEGHGSRAKDAALRQPQAAASEGTPRIQVGQMRSAGSSVGASRIPIRLEADDDAWLKKVNFATLNQNGTTTTPIDLSFPGGRTKVRPWRREHLSRGLLAANHHQFRPMLERLNRGDPIHVLAYGSSLTQDMAGCFHTGPTQTLAKRIGADKLPDRSVIYRSKADRFGRECEDNNPTWGNMFMQVINATWPHPGHTFINAGIAACSLECPYNHGCMETNFPAHLELLVLEAYGITKGDVLERLLWRIFTYYTKQGKPRPAVVFIRSGFVANHEESKESDTCLRDAEKCESVCGHGPFNHTLRPEEFNVQEEYEVLALAQYYGFTVISHRHFLASMLRDGVPKQMLKEKKAEIEKAGDKSWGDMSDCRFMSAIHSDTIHVDSMGRMLYADYLLNAVAGAQEFLAVATAPDAATFPLLPTEPLYKGGWDVAKDKCTTMVDARKGTSKQANPGEAVVLVTQADGWTFSEYQVHGAHRKYKPGWIATEAGAKMTLQLNTVFPKDRYFKEDEPLGGFFTTVMITYLESYEHMGQVKASCVSGCACDTKVADAHQPATRASVAHTMELTTKPPHEKCTIQLELLRETRSGERKFKVLGVSAKKGMQAWEA